MVDVDTVNTRVTPIFARRRGVFTGRGLNLAALVTTFALIAPAFAQDTWKTSPFHGMPNAATGKNVPCVCRYKGSKLPLGAEVCWTTLNDMMLSRCDLLFNNTTWAPTTNPCELSS
jgi:hypothetical protein